MIENIYSSDKGNNSHTGKSNNKIKTPKNVRQIGKIGDSLKIYVEDYVKTYTRQLAEGEYAQRCVAILIGEYRIIDGVKDVFIYGAIGTSEAYDGENIQFTEGIWTNTYEMIKQYFPDGEIVGWYYGGTSFGLEETKRLQQVHLDNFAGGDKLLYTYDILEREDNFYLYVNGAMVLQPGYYIYYERNDEMQSYMVEHKKVKQEEILVEDRAIKEIRTKLKEKQQAPTNESEQKAVMRLTYAAGTLIMIVALVVIVTIMNNSEKMKTLEEALNTISNRLAIQSNDDNVNEHSSVGENIFDIDGEDDENSIPASNTNGVESEDNSEDSMQASVTPATDNLESKTEEKNDGSGEKEDTITKGDDSQQITPTPTTIPTPTTTENSSNGENSNVTESAEGTNTDTDHQAEANTNGEGAKDSNTSSDESKETSTIDSSKLRKYTVKSGDTIASICLKFYGDYKNMQTIKELNQLVDENKIIEGQVLIIP